MMTDQRNTAGVAAAFARRLAPSRGLLLVLLTLGCCGDDDGITFFGEVGQPTPLSHRGWVLWVDAEVDGEQGPMLVDTGLPMTTLYQSQLPTLQPGKAEVELEAFGLRFPSLDVLVVEGADSKQVCQTERPMGLFGHDLLHHFDMLVDYRGDRITLSDAPLQPEPDDVEPATEVPLQVLGGGTLRLDELAKPLQVPATRLVVEASAEGGDTRAAVIDTGASLTIIRKRALDKLGDDDRPRLCCVTVALIEGTTRLPVSRLREVTVGDVTVKNVPVVVFDDDELFTSLAAEIGRPIDLIIGGSFLRSFAVELSYREQVLSLHRYDSAPHIDVDEYLLPGFSFCEAAGADGMVVLDVYEGSDAESKGVEPGNLLLAVDGKDVTKLDVAETMKLLRSREPGGSARMSFKSVGDLEVDLDVAVEQLLPDYL